MIKTKTAQIIDAQNGNVAEVYFSVTQERKLYSTKTIEFTILSSVIATDQNGNSQLVGIKENKAVFKLSTFDALFGAMTINEYEATKDQILINQIDYINKHVWTGNEPMLKNSYWNLVKTDLEIVS